MLGLNATATRIAVGVLVGLNTAVYATAAWITASAWVLALAALTTAAWVAVVVLLAVRLLRKKRQGQEEAQAVVEEPLQEEEREEDPEILQQVLLHYPEALHDTIRESWHDQTVYNLASERGFSQKGLQRERRRWAAVSGQRSNILTVYTLAGLVAGFLSGLVLGIHPNTPAQILYAAMVGDPFATSGWAILISGCIGAAAGAWTFRLALGLPAVYWSVVVELWIASRSSKISKYRTASVMRARVPKALMAWRVKDWERHHGRIVCRVKLPYGEIIEEWGPVSPRDFILLRRDEHRARDGAVGETRAVNRLLSRGATVTANGFRPKKEEPMKGLIIPIIAGVMIIGSVVIAAFATGD